MMLAHHNLTVLPVAPVTPTQQKLQLAHLARRQRLGLVPVRSVAPVLKRRDDPPAVEATPAPRDRAGTMDATAQGRAIAILLEAGVPRAEILPMLGISWSTLSKRIRATGTVGLGKARLRAEAAARIARETGQIARGLAAGVGVAQLALILDVSEATVRNHVRAAGLLLPGRRVGAPRVAPREAEMRISMLLAAVARRRGVHVNQLLGRSRDKVLSAARGEVAARLFDELGFSATEIGVVLGGRDHSSISYLIARHRQKASAK